MTSYWSEGLYVEVSDHEGDEEWFTDSMVKVAGYLFPQRFRISMRCRTSDVEMCIALESEFGGFTEQENGITIHGVRSDRERDQVRVAARKLALPLALAHMPFGPTRQTEEGWEWAASGWGPQAVRKVDDLPSPQLALLKELRRRTGPKWWDIYLPRIKETARVVQQAPPHESTRKVITERVCKATCVSRTQAYKDLDTARELYFLPESRPVQKTPSLP
ncbi:hypothetical protein AB0D56_26990 [Streptomyces sp. NPDC048209]|uniref:hypothetical protein n=1 Tax=Streptomyces sp. NPDC048209 TaxID=3156689 RepID=UPI00342110D0